MRTRRHVLAGQKCVLMHYLCHCFAQEPFQPPLSGGAPWDLPCSPSLAEMSPPSSPLKPCCTLGVLPAVGLALGCHGDSPPFLTGRDFTHPLAAPRGSGSEPDLSARSVGGPPCASTSAAEPGQHDAILDGGAGRNAQVWSLRRLNWAASVGLAGGTAARLLTAWPTWPG